MEPAKKKQQHSETSLYPAHAASEIAELRQVLESNIRHISQLEAEITSLKAHVSELEATVTSMEEKSREKPLPPEVWARILEFSEYSDVARMARVSRFFLHDVMSQVKCLCFDDENGLVPEQIKRFDNGNVEEIIIDCLFQYRVPRGRRFFTIQSYWEHGSVLGTFTLGSWVRHGAFTSLLISFPTLKHVFLGKGICETKNEILDRLSIEGNAEVGYPYYNTPFNRPAGLGRPMDEENASIYRSMLQSLAHAYGNKSLSSDLIIHGLPSNHYCMDDRRHSGNDGECRTCQSICSHFPLSQVAAPPYKRAVYCPQNLSCLSLDQRFELIAQRQGGGNEALMASQIALFLTLLNRHTFRQFLEEPNNWIILYEENELNGFAKLISLGCDPRCVPRQAVSQVFSHTEYLDEPSRYLHVKEHAFRRLVDMGVPLQDQYFMVVPDDVRLDLETHI